jgi:hypothetical protein
MNYKIITLLKLGETYYMQFGFKPISKIKNKDKTIDIKILIDNIKECTWLDLDRFMNSTSIFINENRIYSLYFIKSNKKWKEFKSFFEEKYERPFDSFKEFKNTTCHLFIIWLEFYIHSANNIELYKRFIDPILLENCKLKELKEIYDILLSVKWINNNI